MNAVSKIALALATAMLLAACDDRGDEAPPVATRPAEAPNSYLKYLNQQASLPAGDYEVVVATNGAGRSGYYNLAITLDDGTVQREQGAWSGSGGQDPDAAGNPRYPVTLTRAGGLRVELEAAVNGYLYLVRDGRVIAEDDDSGDNGNPLIDLAASRISSAAYAQAYYDAVDPDGERATLDGYKRKHCFIEGNPECEAEESIGHDAHVVFRDSKDLGYGRNMYVRRNTRGTPDEADDTIAFFVENYVIKLQPGSSTNYGPVNVEAAVREDRQYHVGTNAIEFSPIDPDDPSSEHITRFFTYNPAGQRITSADLDGRGVKHMPGMCWSCHGGRTLPLEPDGTFPLLSLRSAKLNQLELDTFDYSALAGFSRAEQEEGFRTINRYVYQSFAAMQARDADEPAKWHADFAMDIAQGRYGGSGVPEDDYQEDYVPEGWRQTLDRPEGVEDLYKRVVEPHCVACHSLQGHQAAEDVGGMANAINFSSWEKFISYRATIIDYVFRRGVMPLSLRNAEDFWRDPQDKPALLASFLNDPTLFDTAGNVWKPGLPVAKPGSDRTQPSPVQLDGTASPYAQVYDWQIVDAPLGATVSLDDATAARPVLTADTDGDYLLSLRVGNGLGVSEAVEFTVTIDSAAAHPDTLTFADDIMPLLGSNDGSLCASCHRSPTSYDGIPVVYRESDNPNLYRDVYERINLADPENSLLLVKPTGERHGGDVQIDRATLDGAAAYNTIANWIRAGARCGDEPLPAVCE